jgi:hypothetical protein
MSQIKQGRIIYYMMDEVVKAEWAKVRDLPSLRAHYGPKEYAKWRGRFVRAGFVTPRKTRTREQQEASKQRRLDYTRQYYRQWRKQNKDRLKQYQYSYWKTRLLNDFQNQVPACV